MLRCRLIGGCYGSLDLGGNNLLVLPDSFGELQSLSDLNLRGNKLTVLPRSFGGLKSLVEVDLWRNKLTALPDSFCELVGLLDLNLGGNSLVKSREEGPEAAAKYRDEALFPERAPMDWLDGESVPDGFEVWDDSDPLAEHRDALDEVSVSGVLPAGVDLQIVEAYVRERATAVARTGSDEALRRGVAVAVGLDEPSLRVMGHAVAYHDGQVERNRLDQLRSELPASLDPDWPSRWSAVANGGSIEGIVETGLFSGLKYSKQWSGPDS